MTKVKLDTYFDGLAPLYANLSEYVISKGYDDPDYGFIESVRYLETFRKSFTLYKEGREQKKLLHVSIYRMETGRYELTAYIQ